MLYNDALKIEDGDFQYMDCCLVSGQYINIHASIVITVFEKLGFSLICSKMSEQNSILFRFYSSDKFFSCSTPLLKCVEYLLCPSRTFQEHQEHSIYDLSLLFFELLQYFSRFLLCVVGHTITIFSKYLMPFKEMRTGNNFHKLLPASEKPLLLTFFKFHKK